MFVLLSEIGSGVETLIVNCHATNILFLCWKLRGLGKMKLNELGSQKLERKVIRKVRN